MPEDEHLHIVIQGPPAVSSGPLHLKLNCFVLGDDPRRVFEIKIASTESVSALKKLIKDAKKQFDHVDADGLELRQVKINYDLHLLNPIGDEGVELKPLTELSEVFKDGVECECIHVVVRHPAVARYIPAVDRRFAYLKKGAGTPSAGAKPSAFSRKQDEQEYLCNRPCTAADPVPVTLLEPIFAEFVDDCQNHQPTACDNEFVRQLSENMSSFYSDELTRMSVFWQVLRDYGITFNTSIVNSTKCTAVGRLLSTNGKFMQVIVEGKNEIGSGDAEPFAEAMLYYRKFIEDSKIEMVRLRSVLPCIHIIVFGACIGFAGSIFTEKVQSDVLVSIIPLFWHSTDLHMQVMAAHTFGALKITIEKLTHLYSQPIPPLKPEDPSLGCPYPRSYTTSSGQIQEFSYDETQMLRDQLIFFGELVGDAAGRKICIKFVRHYSREAHDFCARKGHAPELIAYKPLAGGWNMVIMDALDIDNGRFAQRPGSYRPLSAMAVLDRQPLKEAITSLIQELHNYNDGYVHGELRDTNLFVRDNKDFMLLDFDWAGPIEKARYPMYVNRINIRRPDGAWDGEKIVAKHDLDMLEYIFHPEEDGREPAAKRRRLSTDEGLSMAI
ncbi:hypothetical protein EV702DRAFT_789503 [Suillus placidus]|uniref:Crinkler effector protein N-terminal domain-containing protein n=1 Tax=Suillus placidus TaxID=48579 RepID=A0A9P6ZHP2_9AGAM|nr:hypothetical protein EV702DRAFT_789503 [Suillus placidus]